MSKLVLIDGNAIIHRAYHAMPPLNAPNGEPINAVYGFVSMLLKIAEDLKPEYLAVCFDRPEPTFRKKLYEEYQSHRPEADDELVGQFSKVREAVKAFNIKSYEKAGYEADDLLGSISEKVKGEKLKVKSDIDEIIIVTGDKDILQLVDDKKQIRVYLPVKGLSNAKMMSEKDVLEKLGIKSSQVVDYKALVGDPSDHYPGVFGIGPKTAVALLSEFGTVDALYKWLDKTTNKKVETLSSQKVQNELKWKGVTVNTAKKLLEGRDGAEISHKLATIVRDVKVDLNLEDLKKWDLGSPKVENKFSEFGFRTLKRRTTQLAKKIENEKQTSLF